MNNPKDPVDDVDEIIAVVALDDNHIQGLLNKLSHLIKLYVKVK